VNVFRIIGIVAAQRATDQATQIRKAAGYGDDRGRLVPPGAQRIARNGTCVPKGPPSDPRRSSNRQLVDGSQAASSARERRQAFGHSPAVTGPGTRIRRAGRAFVHSAR
jgi:hypothetical protein